MVDNILGRKASILSADGQSAGLSNGILCSNIQLFSQYPLPAKKSSAFNAHLNIGDVNQTIYRMEPAKTRPHFSSRESQKVIGFSRVLFLRFASRRSRLGGISNIMTLGQQLSRSTKLHHQINLEGLPQHSCGISHPAETKLGFSNDD